MPVNTFLAITGSSLARATFANNQWSVQHLLVGEGLNCLAADPAHPATAYAGTRRQGVLRSTDAGQTWQPAGLAGHDVKALAVSRAEPGVIYAGTRPPALYVSRDGGAQWMELESFRRARQWWWLSPAEPPDLTPYVQGLALSPTEPEVILAGIEAGAVLRSADGGQTWQGHRPGALRDCHSITFHATNGDWAYEAGGTGAGVAVSRDGGQNWQQPRAGLDRHYGWAVAADAARPEVWYASLSPMIAWARPGPPAAHVDGYANAYIFRSVGGAAWHKLGGGLPQPLDYMAYALVTDPFELPGHLYAGLSNGDIWHSTDHGLAWTQLPLNVKAIRRTLIALA
jgi:photosystem II stability/assembly factor-like uncharacterized protein